MIIKPTTPKIYTPQDGSCVFNLSGRDVRGGKIYDRSGKGNHGAITGAVLKPSNYGLPVLQFDGIDDYVDCGAFQYLEVFTLEAWIKAETDVNNYRTILNKEVSFSNRNYWLLLDQTTGYFGLRFSVASTSKAFFSTKALNDNSWHYVAATYNNSFVHLYVDGILIGTPFAQTGLPNNSVANLNIGYQLPATPRCFKGIINDVRIFNRAKSIQEEIEYFNRTKHLYGK